MPIRRAIDVARSRFIARTLIALAAASSSACRDATLALGANPALARANASTLFGALGDRFTNVVRTPKFFAARSRIAKHALTPSDVFRDTSIWTTTNADGARTLAIAGALDANRRYVLDARASADVPVRPGDSRHVITLRHLGDDDYRWTTHVDLAAGGAAASDIARYFGAVIASTNASDAQLRADYRNGLPRTTHALARMWTLDTLRRQPLSDGSAIVTLIATMHSDRLRAAGMPAFAAYVDRYIAPSRSRLVATDLSGARWLDVSARDRKLTARMRVGADGRLMSFDAGTRHGLPDTLQLRMEFFAHIRFFDVGATDIIAEATSIETTNERGWSLRFTKEPDWHLPLFTEHLLRAPLRRPFEGNGTVASLGVRSSGGRTLITRDLDITVRESAILRWLGALGFAAMNDFAGKAETEENRYLAEVFRAMAEDASGAPRARVASEGMESDSARLR